MMQTGLSKFTTCLWFDNDAEEALKAYAKIFANAKLESISYYGDAGYEVHHQPKGAVLTVTMSIDGQEIMGLNGGPILSVNPAISLYVTCKSEKEIDELYAKLVDGGSIMMPLQKYPFSEKYSWIKDKFGVSWQLNMTDNSAQKVAPCLMFTNEQRKRAEEAINFYTTIFANSSIDYLAKYEDHEQLPGGVKHSTFTLNGQKFVAMDSPIDHEFGFTPATSIVVNCETQKEIDEAWEKLHADGGAPGECGWLTDKFGVSWQVVPTSLRKMLTDPNEEKRDKVLAVIMQSKKLDINKLETAFG